MLHVSVFGRKKNYFSKIARCSDKFESCPNIGITHEGIFGNHNDDSESSSNYYLLKELKEELINTS